MLLSAVSDQQSAEQIDITAFLLNADCLIRKWIVPDEHETNVSTS